MKITIIVPCYNEQDAIPLMYEELKKIMHELKTYIFEIIFINDGSKDNTLHIIKELANSDDRIIYLSFSRNFGKEAAMYAGLCNASGDYIAIMDADMQDPPSLLPTMLKIIEEKNYDSVATRRETREGEPVIRSFFARIFYCIINKISDADIVDGARDFRLMKREMVNAIIAMSEYNRFSKGIFGWVGFKTYWLSYKNVERVAGETKWNFWKLFKYSIDGIINFSQMPLTIAAWSGVGCTLLSFIMIAVIIVRKLIFGDPVAGWASMVCIIMLVGGIQLFCMGIMGQYLSKMYLEIKKRPHCIISETNVENINRIL